ncbi:MAG: LysM peptidoglycan-binding domain-containing protein [Syntrophomonadaceae bacterium]|nr:LysM peptidoglycan-binding domain-containing protein [Syntrophomonadaceae bacterium]
MKMLQSLASKAISMFVKQDAVIINLDKNEQIPVQFNPAEYSLIEGADYTHVKRQNSDSPVLNFAGGQQPRLKMTLYFDTYHVKTSALDLTEEKDVSEQVEKLAKLRQIAGSAHRPPVVAFVWGSLKFIGFINSVTTTYTMFSKDGKPLRAKMDVNFIGVPNEDGSRRSPFESPDRTKIRILSEDESLWSIARKEYGDEGKWRHIAKANGIMDPLEIPVGTLLKVPAI